MGIRKIEDINVDFSKLKKVLKGHNIEYLENIQKRKGKVTGFQYKNGYIETETSTKNYIPKDYTIKGDE